MQAGFDKLVDLVRPTLGPLPHFVANEKIVQRDELPEILDSGGTIARRVVQIADRDQDVGFMHLRHVLWKLQEAEGDGTATAAMLFQAIYRNGQRYLAAGGNPMGLRAHLESGMRLVLATLDGQVSRLHGKTALSGLARTICYDDEMARMLGEIFDIIGAYGRLEVRRGSSREMIREYVEGMYWENGLRSRDMGNADLGLRANFENAAILISDLEIEEPEQLIPLLNLALRNNIKELLLVSSSLSEKCMGMLLAKPNRDKVLVAAVKLPGMTLDAQMAALEDLAILTGGRALLKVTNATLASVRLEDLGRARRIWADTAFFGIIGGRGDPRLIRQHIARLRENYRNVLGSVTKKEYDITTDKAKLLERLGKLSGGSATLYIGGGSPSAIDERTELAKRTSDAMRGAMRDGVVPGGGVALLNCRAALRERLAQAQDSDERAAYRMLLEAVEAPFRTILENAGVWPSKVLAEIDALGAEYGYDVLARKVVKMRDAGLFDAAPVVKGAARSAIAGAIMALSTEAIVHRRNPPEEMNT